MLTFYSFTYKREDVNESTLVPRKIAW